MDRDVPLRIKNFNAGREQYALPIKYKLMATGPFRFFRGTCHLFYADLLAENLFSSSPLTWICGDLHIENFGCYKGLNRLVYFDMNDFDEAIRAPLLYEISRLVVSVEVAATEMKLPAKEKKKLIQVLLYQYQQTLIKNKAINIEKGTATGLIKTLIDKVGERKEKELVAKRTNNKKLGAKLLITDQLLELPKNEKRPLGKAFAEWFSEEHGKGYQVADIGYRIAGTGSIGVKRYICLLENSSNPAQKKLIDVKQALPSSILAHTKIKQPEWANEAARIISIQEMMQHVAPAFLSPFQYEQDWYMVKEIQPTSDKISLDRFINQPLNIEKYISDLGLLTASAQLRSSGRYKAANADALKLFAQEEGWIKQVSEWAAYYATQIKKDYKSFYTAWKDGYFNT